jgi:dienelactone hydrolase
MLGSKTRMALSILFIALFLSSTYFAITLNSDFGKLEVKTLEITDKNNRLSGLLYQPIASSVETPYPAIVLAHGISESKEMMSNLGLELARRGYVVLCLDLPGHGNSDGTIGQANNEPDLGIQSAIDYLVSLQFVNSSAIGLVGHSLGAGAVRAADAENSQISATVLIGGGIGTAAQGSQYGVLNSTFPKNLLIIVGRYDVLFNLTDLTSNELPAAFNNSTPIEADMLYGNFQNQTARKLVTPSTTHLFESVDPTVIQETTLWMENSIKTTQTSETSNKRNIIYLERETTLLIAIVGLFAIVYLAYHPIATVRSLKPKEEKTMDNNQTTESLKAYVVWGILNLALFFPMVAVGAVISFPPLVFGSSIAWWVLATGLTGMLLISRNRPRLSEKRIQLKATLKNAFIKREILIACILFLLLFAIASLLQTFYNINLRILAPIFQELSSLRRIIAFFTFVPFFLTYFVAEGLYLHDFQQTKTRNGNWTGVANYIKVVFAKIAPFLIIIGLQYLPKLLFNIWIFPSFVGFIAEFLWLIVPIFIITSVSSTFFYKNTHNIAAGAVFNTLMLAWIASVVFPF